MFAKMFLASFHPEFAAKTGETLDYVYRSSSATYVPEITDIKKSFVPNTARERERKKLHILH